MVMRYKYVMAKKNLRCKFCDKDFKSELTLIKHTCRIKLRHLDKDTANGRIAFLVYEIFMEKSCNQKVTMEKFIKSRYYISFYKFAKYLIELKLDDVKLFVNFLIDNSVPMHKWSGIIIFDEFILWQQLKEPWERGLEKSIGTMVNWAKVNDLDFMDFYDKASSNEITHLIRLGRLSPWLIFASAKAQDMILRLNEEQLMMIHKFIDSRVWKNRLSEMEELKQFIKESGL